MKRNASEHFPAGADGKEVAHELPRPRRLVKTLALLALVVAVYVLHQDFWNWQRIEPLVMRAVFIGAGIALIQKFHWIIYIFGAKMLLVIVGLLAVAVVASLLHASRRREPTETANPSKASQPAEL